MGHYTIETERWVGYVEFRLTRTDSGDDPIRICLSLAQAAGLGRELAQLSADGKPIRLDGPVADDAKCFYCRGEAQVVLCFAISGERDVCLGCGQHQLDDELVDETVTTRERL